jgi:myo-inositol-1(or 4)-monophosphatase
MYDEIVSLIKECGDDLPPLSGTIADLGVKKKWLTEKDVEIEKRLSNMIAQFEGEHEIFAEEFHDDYREAENVWIIDPISNTMGFINGWTHYSVVVSHMHKGVLQFGAVYDPMVKELFTAYKGKGAFLNGKKIQVSQRTQDLSFLFQANVGLIYEKDWILKVYSELLDMGRVNTLGSLGLNYCYVACGRVDAAIVLNKDTFPEFAGKIIVEEAGGVLTDIKSHELTKNSRGILACRKDMYESLLAMVA